jgi:hypothetical protein
LAEVRLIEELTGRAPAMKSCAEVDVARCTELLLKYQVDLGLGDATVAATSEQLKIRPILTIEERGFGAVQVQ